MKDSKTKPKPTEENAQPLEIIQPETIATNTSTKKKIDGRTTAFYSTERKAEIKAQLIESIAQGIPEAVALRDNPNMPNVETVFQWRKRDEAFSQSIAHARKLGHDAIAVECLQIADDSSNDRTTDEDGREQTNSEVIQRSKLRVETRLKLLSKWDPKRYGDRIQADVTAKVITATLDVTMTPEASAEAYKELMA